MLTLNTDRKTLSLAEVRQAANESAKLNEDRNYEAQSLKFQNGHLLTPDGPLPMTLKAAKQFAGRGGVPGTVFDYLLQEFKAAKEAGRAFPEFTSVIQQSWDRYAEKRNASMLVRLRHNGATRVRAVLTDRYGVMDNHEFLAELEAHLPAEMKDVRFSGIKNQLSLDADGLRCKLLIPGADLGSFSDGHRPPVLHESARFR
jgi:hypothetical protein